MHYDEGDWYMPVGDSTVRNREASAVTWKGLWSGIGGFVAVVLAAITMHHSIGHPDHLLDREFERLLKLHSQQPHVGAITRAEYERSESQHDDHVRDRIEGLSQRLLRLESRLDKLVDGEDEPARRTNNTNHVAKPKANALGDWRTTAPEVQ